MARIHPTTWLSSAHGALSVQRFAEREQQHLRNAALHKHGVGPQARDVLAAYVYRGAANAQAGPLRMIDQALASPSLARADRSSLGAAGVQLGMAVVLLPKALAALGGALVGTLGGLFAVARLVFMGALPPAPKTPARVVAQEPPRLAPHVPLPSLGELLGWPDAAAPQLAELPLLPALGELLTQDERVERLVPKLEPTAMWQPQDDEAFVDVSSGAELRPIIDVQSRYRRRVMERAPWQLPVERGDAQHYGVSRQLVLDLVRQGNPVVLHGADASTRLDWLMREVAQNAAENDDARRAAAEAAITPLLLQLCQNNAHWARSLSQAMHQGFWGELLQHVDTAWTMGGQRLKMPPVMSHLEHMSLEIYGAHKRSYVALRGELLWAPKIQVALGGGFGTVNERGEMTSRTQNVFLGLQDPEPLHVVADVRIYAPKRHWRTRAYINRAPKFSLSLQRRNEATTVRGPFAYVGHDGARAVTHAP